MQQLLLLLLLTQISDHKVERGQVSSWLTALATAAAAAVLLPTQIRWSQGGT
jgi:hypothetical protein